MNLLVLDTNILMSALIRNSLTREIIESLKINYLFPDYGLDEIYSNKKEIIMKAKISEREFDILLLRILKYVRVIPFDVISSYATKADEIIGCIHKTDVPFIATALAFNCPVWSDDKHFKKQDRVKVLTSKDMIEMLGEDTK
ncbi:MAG: PIN domain-containing protein [archaeon]